MTEFRENTHLYKHGMLESIKHHVFVWKISCITDLWCKLLETNSMQARQLSYGLYRGAHHTVEAFSLASVLMSLCVCLICIGKSLLESKRIPKMGPYHETCTHRKNCEKNRNFHSRACTNLHDMQEPLDVISIDKAFWGYVRLSRRKTAFPLSEQEQGVLCIILAANPLFVALVSRWPQKLEDSSFKNRVFQG